MIAALVLAGALAQGAAQAGDELPRRAPIAHLAGFETTSAVRFASEPERLHRLVATHVFPSRARWLLTLANEPNHARSIYYRAGARWYAHDEAASASRELAGEEREQIEHFFTLRQALVLWPNGFDWQPDGARRRARLETGSLRVELDSDARPRLLAWLDPQGAELESLREVVWRLEGNRAEPASFALARRGEVAWHESVQSVEFEVAYLDDFFTPADRRPRDPQGERGASLEHVELPARFVRRLAADLGPSSDWGELARRALAAREALARDPATLGLKLDEGVELELDAAGQPVAAWARLADGTGTTSREWTRRAGANALSARLPAGTRSPAAALARLLERVPPGARPGSAYVRVAAGASGRELQLVLPLVPLE